LGAAGFVGDIRIEKTFFADGLLLVEGSAPFSS
jgi:hypothetical protein